MNFPRPSFAIIGTGPYQPELERLVLGLGLTERVTIGAIPPTDRSAMARALAGCSLIVLMSEFETHPLAVIEALALGRPALVADTSGLHELAQRGLARAVPLDSTPDELAAAIVDEIRHPSPVPAVSAPTWRQCADELLALYGEVLSPRPSSARADTATRMQGE